MKTKEPNVSFIVNNKGQRMKKALETAFPKADKWMWQGLGETFPLWFPSQVVGEKVAVKGERIIIVGGPRKKKSKSKSRG